MEITGGFVLPLTGDEQEIIKVLEKDDVIWEEELDDYAKTIASQMVSKGLLNRVVEGNKIGFQPNIGD